MRWILFKIIAFAAVFIFTQGAILPWVISNNAIPLWLDIVLVTIILMVWLAVIDRLAYLLIKALRRNDEVTE